MAEGCAAMAGRLRQLRREKAAQLGRPVTQAEVARAVGVSENSMGNYECGVYGMGLSTALRLARYYGVTVEQLAGKEAAR